jgi:hypothetical protein
LSPFFSEDIVNVKTAKGYARLNNEEKVKHFKEWSI